MRTSGFFGAMDGASKFVRGDAIAGLLITVINIIAGVIIGVIAMSFFVIAFIAFMERAPMRSPSSTPSDTESKTTRRRSGWTRTARKPAGRCGRGVRRADARCA